MPGPSRDLLTLARLHGILPAYTDLTGRRVSASEESLWAVIDEAAGETVPRDLHEALRARRHELGERAVPEVVVCWADEDPAVSVWLDVDAPFDVGFTLALEHGTERRHRPAGGAPRRTRRSGGRVLVERRIRLPWELPPGYHDLRIETRRGVFESLLIAAPAHAFVPSASRPWGVFVPLHALHSARSHGGGHLSDLARFADFIGELGGGVVATLPLLAAYLDEPYDPSPYAPVSRLFWNELFIDLAAVPELAHDAKARRLLESARIQDRFRALRAAPEMDARAQMSAMREVLGALAKGFFRRDSERRETFERFRQERPELEPYARFRAVVDRRREPPGRWPKRLRDGAATPDDYDLADARYHEYVQWICEEQIARAADAARRRGPGLYLDLPAGAHPDGYDVHHGQRLFTRNVAVGAPPDPLAPLGQDWGFPALRPRAVCEDRFSHVIAYVRHHARHAGVLRVDHFMGLERLFWIPRGMEARDGAYVRYPREALHAILCIESHRHGTLLVGEDLGTVPEGMRARMAHRGILRMHVLQSELAAGAESALSGAGLGAAASLNTHDMPPFGAFLAGRDLAVWSEIGMLEGDRLADAQRERARMRRELELELERRGRTGPSPAPADVLRGSLAELGAGECRLLIVGLEDLWLEERSQNVPGTTSEHPNWKRKSAHALEDIEASPEVRETLVLVDGARRGERAHMASTRRDAASASPPAVPPLAEVVPTPDDLYLFHEGSHFRIYEKLGAHVAEGEGGRGVHFAVWAPNARAVHVLGSFNRWSKKAHPLATLAGSGIWGCFVPGAKEGDAYKFHIVSRVAGKDGDKADPFAFATEVPPLTASVIARPSYAWTDSEWLASRRARQAPSAPISIYEMHLGSWRREGGRSLGYLELADVLPAYLARLGFTHVEFLPIMEHPFAGSWGYQTTGYFAPTSRFGPPEHFMALVDRLHGAGIGVILDWVPSHFPSDGHGLAYFDGTFLYEHADPRKGFHPDWKSHIFNYGRHEVRSFLVSSALFWLDRYHIDGLRVDAVASMLYLDYSRKEGEWIPNEHGGRENLEAITLLRRLNEAIEQHHPGVLRIAEESTSWPKLTKPPEVGGLGFDHKWDMGWMHDTLRYLGLDPIHRRHHHNEITFRMLYAASESFVLALSHDEVVHGKRALLAKMPGDWWQKFATLRALYGYMFAMTGKKLLFMGGEIAQWTEWNHDASLDWALEAEPMHAGIQRWITDLNQAYRAEPALHELDTEPKGFEWIDCHDHEQSTLSMLRSSREARELVLVLANFTPVPRGRFRVGVPRAGRWELLLNGDAARYGGSGVDVPSSIDSEPVGAHERTDSLTLTLPPLAVVFLRGPRAT